ncbi:chymotrypsin A-like [Clavelina lepadiformis]|uniref:Uncharacterized protein n=1 Tax=Clavelina lepadiformis TaxID=159417 RepID=A0ABP0EVR6_CLALP
MNLITLLLLFISLAILNVTDASKDITVANVQACNEIYMLNNSAVLNLSLSTSLVAPSTSCRLDIQAPDAYIILVDFKTFTIPFEQDCLYGYLEIFDGATTDARKFLDRRLCGEQAYRDFLSSSNNVVVIYTTGTSFIFHQVEITFSTEPACADTEFRCWSGACINASFLCDGNRHCLDNSDEIECSLPYQSFEECGKTDVAPVFTWTPRIVGGGGAAPGSWPWQAMLTFDSFFTRSYNLFCGGTVIDKYWILTAAHCVEDELSSTITVYVGKHSRDEFESMEQRLSVKEIFIHPDYNMNVLFGNDIALLQLTSPIEFSRFVRPICLPQSRSEIPPANTTCISTGWGRSEYNSEALTSRFLRQVRLDLPGDLSCGNLYQQIGGSLNSGLPQSLLCAGGSFNADVCQGDSGGPLVCLVGENTWFQFGITSFIITPCGSYPGYYASVAAVVEWANEVRNVPGNGALPGFKAPSLYGFNNLSLLLLLQFTFIVFAKLLLA